MFFFDSHGNAWETCAASAAGAVAFGPRGCARPITAYTLASSLGLVAENEGGVFVRNFIIHEELSSDEPLDLF